MKTVYDLSGGEKARLSLAKLMMQKANLLILDEPTNHLDLDSKEVLENALIEYPGTLLFVSHDRYFVNRMATRVVELSSESMTSFLGDYDYYVAKKEEQAEFKKLEEEKDAAKNPNVTRSASIDKQSKSDFERNKDQQKQQRQRNRRIAEVEKQVEQEEAVIADIEEQLCDPVVFQDHEKSLELNEKLEQTKQHMESLMEEWEELQLNEE